MIFAEYAIDVAQACRERGIKTVAVTAGYVTEDARPEFYRNMDAANVDLKAFTDAFYHRLCFAQLGPVLDTLKYLRRETNVWFEVTTLLIPSENDSDAELHNAAEWFAENLGADVPWHFTAFHPDFKMLDKPHTPPMTLTRAREIACSKGLHYVYTGNVHDREGGSTWCPVDVDLAVTKSPGDSSNAPAIGAREDFRCLWSAPTCRRLEKRGRVRAVQKFRGSSGFFAIPNHRDHALLSLSPSASR